MTFYRDLSEEDNLIRKKVHSRHIFIMGTRRYLPYQPITFMPKDGEGVLYPYKDAMVIVAEIYGFTLKKDFG